MAGATDATEQQKHDGRQEQIDADAHRDAGLDDSLRSVRAVGENRSGSGADNEFADADHESHESHESHEGADHE